MAFDLGAFLIQFILVVGGAALFRRLAQMVRQPGLVGELVYGLMLGPSLLGWAWPHGYALFFPAENRPLIEALGWIGLILFIYTVGAELHWDRVHARPIFYVALGGLTVPFVLGSVLGLSSPQWFFGSGTPAFGGMVLLGVVMAVSALPILGRLLAELQLLTSPTGLITMGASTVDDIVGWVLLALVAGHGRIGLIGNVNLNLLLVAAVFLGALLVDRYLTPFFLEQAGRRNPLLFVMLLLSIFASALLTHEAGLHALLGPFAVGAIISRHPSIKEYTQTRIGEITSVLFMPAFFVLAGMTTDLRLIANAGGAWALLAVVAVASIGKIAGGWLGGLLAGMRPTEGLRVGTLLNTRGAVGLVVASVGLSAGLFSPSGYTLVVVMIIITTFLTPMVLALETRSAHRAPAPAASER